MCNNAVPPNNDNNKNDGIPDRYTSGSTNHNIEYNNPDFTASENREISRRLTEKRLQDLLSCSGFDVIPVWLQAAIVRHDPNCSVYLAHSQFYGVVTEKMPQGKN